MKALHAILALICWFGTTAAYAEDWIVYEGKDGAGKASISSS